MTSSMKPSRLLAVGAALSLGAALTPPAVSQDAQVGDTPRPTLLRLVDDSNFTEGCFGECACLIAFFGDLRGEMTFTLLDASEDGSVSVFEISGVRWRAGLRPLDLRTEFTGGGALTLRRDGNSASAVLDLMLSVNGEPPVRFFSRPAPADDFARGFGFDITVSRFGMECFDTALRVQARRVPGPRPDVNLDGFVGVEDLAALLSAWRSDSKSADIDYSGRVGPQDLAALLASWGQGVAD